MTGPRKPWLVLVAMTGSLSMVMLDQTVVSVALPTMGRELPLSPTGQQWVVNAYVLALAAFVAVGGKAGARWGGVTMFRVGVALFFVSSAACGLAPNGSWGEPWLITSRAAQGVGAALMTPVSATVVIGAFAPDRRGRVMAAYTGISQIFLAVGPLLGGVLTQTVSWRAVFWLNVPVGLAALVLVRIARPNDPRQPDATLRPGSIALLVVGVGATVLAVQQASAWSWTSPLTLTTLTVGVVVAIAFVRLQLRAAEPLVDVRLFARPAFRGNVVVTGLVQSGLIAVVLFSSLYLQDVLDLSPAAAGLAVLPMIVALAAASQVGGRWYDRGGIRPPALTGLALAVVGLGAWTVSLPMLGYPLQVPGMVLTGLGLGLVASPTNTDALASVRPADRDQASGLVQTVRQIGGTTGVALIGAVVLGHEHRGAQSSSPQAAADAITVGFGCAAAAFIAALVFGWRLLPGQGAREASHASSRRSAPGT